MKTSMYTILTIVLMVSLSFYVTSNITGAQIIQSPNVDRSAHGGIGGQSAILQIKNRMRESEVQRQMQQFAINRHKGSLHLPRMELEKFGIHVTSGNIFTPKRQDMILVMHIPSRGPAIIVHAANVTGTGLIRKWDFGGA